MSRPSISTTAAFNPGGARWCEEHQRLECTKHRGKRGGQCHALAMRGLDACSTHCGHSRKVAKAKGEARITAWSAVGQPVKNLDSGMAVLGMLQMTWLRAAAYGELLRQQVAAQGMATSADLPDPESELETSGLIGYRYGAAGKDGRIYAVSEDVRALVSLEAQERDRVVKYAKTAHDMGISERITSLAERWGDVVATRITIILSELKLTPEQESMVPALIQAHLGQIDVMALTTGEGNEE